MWQKRIGWLCAISGGAALLTRGAVGDPHTLTYAVVVFIGVLLLLLRRASG